MDMCRTSAGYNFAAFAQAQESSGHLSLLCVSPAERQMCLLLQGPSPASKKGGSGNVIYKDDIESDPSEEEPALPIRQSRRLVRL